MLILYVAVVLIVAYIFKFYQNVKQYPKGPTPLPFFGNLLEFSPISLHFYLEECQKKYGDIFTIFTPRPLVAIMNYEGIKEAFHTKGDSFVGRTGSYPDDIFQNIQNGGVIFSEGDEWKELRRVAISILRDFGMGKNIMEAQVLESTKDFVKHINGLKDKKHVDFRWPIQTLVANIINHVLFGYKYDFDDPERLQTYVNKLNYLIEDMRKNPFVFLTMKFPFIEKLPIIGYYGVGKYRAVSKQMQEHVLEDIANCKKTLDMHGDPECFVHAFLQKAPNGQYLTNDQMTNVCMDFFLAGMETTSTTLRWGMLFMAKWQGVQDKIRKEVYSVIGKDQDVTMADRMRLPYTNAAVHELQRMANILPLNVMHRTVEDSAVSGVHIPENTLVLGQIYTVLSKGPLYEQPEEYRPERFLMADGKTPNKEALEQLIPFSIGKRQCAGEGLARMELFLGLATIVQNFKIEPPLDGPLNIQPLMGSVRLPPRNLLVVTPL